MNNTYNLLDKKWIPVMTFDNKFKLISLKELFIEAPRIHSLAGEMKSQDLALFRMFESILISVYTRFDIHGRNYEWIETNERDEFIRLTGHYERGDLIETWKNLYRLRKFTSKVIEYLEKHRDSFYLIGDNPFYQVNRSDWDALKKTDKNNKERSNPPELNLMLINRTVCESNNKINVSTPRSFINKNKLEKDELARWLIMYQNFTGTTGKTYADHKVDSASSGWLYKLNPVYARGNNLFETLMLNMVLATSGSDYVPQRPMWEFNDKREYIDKALKQIVPDNVSELYTNWSRVIYVSWGESDPKMYEAMLPRLDNSSAFIEPMTIWSGNTPAKVGDAEQNKAMWRDFGLYINADMKDSMRPRIIDWLNEIRNEPDSPIDDDAMINLCTIRMFNDSNPASQTPVLEVHDELQINEKFLFDRSTMEFWEERIEETIAKTQEIAVKFWCFSTRIATIKYHDSNLKKASMIKYDTINFKNNSDNDKRERVIKRKFKSVKVKSFAERYEQLLYDRLNEPFKHWLHDLRPTDERDEKQAEWYGALESLVEGIVDDMLVSELSPRDLSGFCFREKDAGEKMLNPFREARYFKARIRNELLPES